MGQIIQGDFRPGQHPKNPFSKKEPVPSVARELSQEPDFSLPLADILPQGGGGEELLAFLAGRNIFEIFTACLPTPPGVSEELWKFVSEETLPKMAIHFKNLQGSLSVTGMEELRALVRKYTDLDLVLQIAESDVLDWNTKPAFHLVLFQEAMNRFVPC